LEHELGLVESPLVVTLGASALRAVAGASARLADMRGRPIALGARTLLPTIHPAYLLRLPDPTAKEAEARAFANDLKQAAFLGQRRPAGGRRSIASIERATASYADH
jgi:uracil-DNA glycosylase